MLTLRVIPPRLLRPTAAEPAPRDLAHRYFDHLWRRWGPFSRLAALALAQAARAGRNRSRHGWGAQEHALFQSGDDHEAHLGMAARKGLHRVINPGAYPLASNPLKNKRLFAVRCRAAGLPAPETFEAAPSALGAWLAEGAGVIAKPNFASKGQGVTGFRRVGDGWICDGVALDQSEVERRLRAMLRAGAVVQRTCATHPGLEQISPGALPTLRVMTAVNEAGAIEACDRVIRLSAGGPRPVDNFNAGNLVAAVDAGSRIGNAWGRIGGELAAVERHPTTGACLRGVAVPDLDAAIVLAIRAHGAFRDGFQVVGWDVGIGAEGPVLIEGNWNPGTDILQLVSGRGLGDTRLGALYRRHLDAAPAAVWRAALPVQRELRGRP